MSLEDGKPFDRVRVSVEPGCRQELVGHGIAPLVNGLKYADCDDGDFDYQADRPRLRNSPRGDEEWAAFQRELQGVQPLTPADLEGMRPYAAYR